MSDDWDDEDWEDEEFDHAKSAASLMYYRVDKQLLDLRMVYAYHDEPELIAFKELILGKRESDELRYPELWMGILADVQEELDDHARWRNEMGDWWVTVERMTSEGRHNLVGERIMEFKCKGLHKAAEKAREQRALYAHDHNGRSWVEIELVPAGDDEAPTGGPAKANDDDPDGAA